MKKIIKPALTLSLLLLFATVTSGIELSLKLSGGLSYLNLGTSNIAYQEWISKHKESASQKDWGFIGGDTQAFHNAFDFEGEIFLSITSNIAISFGAGYIYGDLAKEKTEISVERLARTDIHIRPTITSAYPLTFSGYFLIPFKGKVSLFLRAGTGLLWAKYIEREGVYIIRDEDDDVDPSKRKYDFHTSKSASSRGSLFHGGLGMMYEIEPGLFFFIEGAGRLAKVKGFFGENEAGDSGTLFYLEEYFNTLKIWQKKYDIYEEVPEGKRYRNVKEAVIDFSGFSVQIGLKIRF